MATLGPTEGTGLSESVGITPLEVVGVAAGLAFLYYEFQSLYRNTIGGKTH